MTSNFCFFLFQNKNIALKYAQKSKKKLSCICNVYIFAIMVLFFNCIVYNIYHVIIFEKSMNNYSRIYFGSSKPPYMFENIHTQTPSFLPFLLLFSPNLSFSLFISMKNSDADILLFQLNKFWFK